MIIETISGNVLVETLVNDNLEIDKVEFYINSQIVYTDSTAPEYNYLWNTDQQEKMSDFLSITWS